MCLFKKLIINKNKSLSLFLSHTTMVSTDTQEETEKIAGGNGSRQFSHSVPSCTLERRAQRHWLSNWVNTPHVSGTCLEMTQILKASPASVTVPADTRWRIPRRHFLYGITLTVWYLINWEIRCRASILASTWKSVKRNEKVGNRQVGDDERDGPVPKKKTT